MNAILPAFVAIAQTFAAPAFPKWQQVTPQTMLQPVPVSLPANDVPGSMTRYGKVDKLPDYCAILEAGKVVGYRLSCN